MLRYFPVKSISALYNWVRSGTVTIHATIIVKPCEKNSYCGTDYRKCIDGIVKKAKGRWKEQEGVSKEPLEGY
jgi:hypothetical protein